MITPERPESSPSDLACLAHELNSLLDGVRRTVRRVADHQPAAASPLAPALEAIDRLIELVHPLAGGGPVSPVAPRPHESLAAAADAAVNALHALAASAGVFVSTEIDPTAATLPAGDLFTVIHNGLSNAIQACAGSDAGDRRVALSIRSLSGRGLEIAIVDTGPGLPSGWTIDGVPRPDGHGLGLVLARRVCRAHGGSLTISNVPFAGGAVFRAVVPLSGLASAA